MISFWFANNTNFLHLRIRLEETDSDINIDNKACNNNKFVCNKHGYL